HVIEQNLDLASSVIRRPLQPTVAEFPQDPAADCIVNHKLQEKGLENYAILNPGAGWGAKRWPPERYGEVAKRLEALTGIRSLISFGPGEGQMAQHAESMSGGAAARLSLSLTELVSATRGARLFIGGDTGPMHLAAALGVPVVGIFGPTDP